MVKVLAGPFKGAFCSDRNFVETIKVGQVGAMLKVPQNYATDLASIPRWVQRMAPIRFLPDLVAYDYVQHFSSTPGQDVLAWSSNSQSTRFGRVQLATILGLCGEVEQPWDVAGYYGNNVRVYATAIDESSIKFPTGEWILNGSGVLGRTYADSYPFCVYHWGERSVAGLTKEVRALYKFADANQHKLFFIPGDLFDKFDYVQMSVRSLFYEETPSNVVLPPSWLPSGGRICPYCYEPMDYRYHNPITGDCLVGTK